MQDPDLRAELERLQKIVEAQGRRIESLEARLQEPQDPEAPTPIPRQPEQEEPPSQPYTTNFLGRFGDVSATLGGYVDVEYVDRERDGRESGFDPHRFVLLIAATAGPNVKFWSEVEIEHGDSLAIEFAHVDLLITDAFNIRGGIILEPLGRFNLEHDSPLNDLTDRPLVNRFIIPVVLRDAGIGVFGKWDWGRTAWSYEAYVTNGFEVLDADGTLSSSSPKSVLRDGRPHRSGGFEGHFDDFNDDKAVVGRLGFSPTLGVDLGLSAHSGDYDARGDNRLTIVAADLKLDGGALADAFGAEEGLSEFLYAHEWLVEFAHADFERDRFAAASGVPREMGGFTAQWNYHVMPQFMLDLMGDWATDETTFTLVARYDEVWVNLPGSDIRDRRQTFGLNFRPVEATVIKFDYQIDVGGSDEGFLFSIATYF